ncbi:hypothetical protein SAMN05216215_110113 [Saccharopolyspora shandongensis]|uniref:Uncharacterized protein n=1 Tax=Saccharopolyspora shandongensis TaxID=418495 RepID=A0A1H3U1X0_9PSEU|nr:hypothetical protein SAMN05216215_110113 [Saccharopolyspora shandongensis]
MGNDRSINRHRRAGVLGDRDTRTRRCPRRRRLATRLTSRLPTTARRTGRLVDPFAAGLITAFTARHAGRLIDPLAARHAGRLTTAFAATTRLAGELAITARLAAALASRLIAALAAGHAGRPTDPLAARLTGEPAITRLTSRLPTTARRAGRLTDPRTARHITAFAAGHAGGFGPGLPRTIGLTRGPTGGFGPGLPHTIGLTGGVRARVGLIVGDNLIGVGCRPGTCPVGLGLRGTTQPEPLAPGGTGGMRDDLARAALTGGA